jgi:hypothetical protein
MKLRMPKGCDSIGHGGNEYIPNNHTRIVEVPFHVGITLLATSSGAQRVSDAEGEEEDFFAMRHPRNPLQSLTSRGRVFHPEDGVIHVERAAVVDAIRSGFVLLEV